MPDYEKMYYHLFNKMTDIIEELKQLQQQTEEMFLNTEGVQEDKICVEKASE